MARIFKRGKIWWIEYDRSQGRRRESLKVTSKRLAEDILEQYERRRLLGELTDVEPIQFDEFSNVYMELKMGQKSDSSRTRDLNSLKKLLPHFGSMYLENITHEDIERYKSARVNSTWGKKTKKKTQPTTINKELCLLRALLTEANRMGYLRRRPKVELFSEPEVEPTYLSAEETTKLLQSTSGQIRVFIAIGLNTGLRSGEIYNLKWKDVHLNERYLVVQKAKGRRFRSLPINDFLLNVLRSHTRHITCEHVLYKSDGSPYRNLRWSFEKACREAGVPRIRIHDMRHTFISNLVMSGVDLRQVQDLAGHRDIKTTMRYAHLTPGRGLGAVNSLNWSNANTDISDMDTERTHS